MEPLHDKQFHFVTGQTSPAAIMLKIVMESPKAEEFQRLISNKHVVNCVLQGLSKRAIRRPGAATV